MTLFRHFKFTQEFLAIDPNNERSCTEAGTRLLAFINKLTSCVNELEKFPSCDIPAPAGASGSSHGFFHSGSSAMQYFKTHQLSANFSNIRRATLLSNLRIKQSRFIHQLLSKQSKTTLLFKTPKSCSTAILTPMARNLSFSSTTKSFLTRCLRIKPFSNSAKPIMPVGIVFILHLFYCSQLAF